MSRFIVGLTVDSSRRRLRPAAIAVVAGVAMTAFCRVATAAEVEAAGSVTIAGPTAPGAVGVGATAASPAAEPAPIPPPAPVNAGATAPTAEENLIPPHVQGAAVPVSGGGYCYGGPHPAPGGGWEAIATPHTHNYAPFDMRLFSQREGCYYFIGDPRDFGYTGQVYNYYGAHPVHDTYGGGWCFMVGGHYHWWRPWSPYFTVVGPWFYWYGPYDPFFWSYWPYYSYYYRSYYPSYYAGGRYYRNGYRVAPPITRVPPTGWRGTPPGGSTAPAGGWRGMPQGTQASPLRSGTPPAGGWRGAPGGAAAGPATGGAWRAPGGAAPAPGAAGGGWRGAPGGGWQQQHGNLGTPGGAWHGGAPSGAPGGGWHGAPSGGGFRPPGGGGWHGAPSGGGFRSPGGGFGGGFRGGGSPGGGFRGGGGWRR